MQPKGVIEPDITDVLNEFKLDIFASLNCVKVGTIKSFNPTAKTAQVQILFKRIKSDGTILSYSPLVDVPVFTLQGGGGFIQFPVQSGDPCILLFSDRRIDEWFQNGAESLPGDSRMHDLSDGIALVGINALNSALPPYPSAKAIMAYGGVNIILEKIGPGLVSIQNASTSLTTCLANLLLALESLTVTVSGSTGVVSAATVTALQAVQTSLNNILG